MCEALSNGVSYDLLNRNGAVRCRGTEALLNMGQDNDLTHIDRAGSDFHLHGLSRQVS